MMTRYDRCGDPIEAEDPQPDRSYVAVCSLTVARTTRVRARRSSPRGGSTSDRRVSALVSMKGTSGCCRRSIGYTHRSPKPVWVP